MRRHRMGSASHLLYRVKNRSLYPKGWRELEKKTLLNHPWCAFCGAKDRLQVHRIEPVHLRPDLVLNESNLIVLCQSCHLREGHVSDFRRGHDPNIKTRAFENLTAI